MYGILPPDLDGWEELGRCEFLVWASVIALIAVGVGVFIVLADQGVF